MKAPRYQQSPSGLVVPAEPPKPVPQRQLYTFETWNLESMLDNIKRLDEAGGRFISLVAYDTSFHFKGRFVLAYEREEEWDGFEELC